MFARNWLIFPVALGYAAFLGVSAAPCAAEEKQGTPLVLETAHFEKPIVTMTGKVGAKTVGLEAKLDGQGGGTGTLTLDPNLVVGRASTLMRIWSVKVTLKEVKADESAKKGRQLYELNGKGLEEHLLVSVPTKGEGSCWLLIAGKQGIDDIIELKRK